jgi:hypothetical protein
MCDSECQTTKLFVVQEARISAAAKRVVVDLQHEPVLSLAAIVRSDDPDDYTHRQTWFAMMAEEPRDPITAPPARRLP